MTVTQERSAAGSAGPAAARGKCGGRARFWRAATGVLPTVALLLLTVNTHAALNYVLSETGTPDDNFLTFDVFNPNNSGGSSLESFRVPCEGFVEGSAFIDTGWNISYDADAKWLSFTSPNALANLGANGALSLYFSTTTPYRAWRTMVFQSSGQGPYELHNVRLPVAAPEPPLLTATVSGTNLLLTLPTIGGMPYQITMQPTPATNAPQTVLTNFLGGGTNLVISLPATNTAAFFRAAILPY